jgi:hypothetical protein
MMEDEEIPFHTEIENMLKDDLTKLNKMLSRSTMNAHLRTTQRQSHHKE